MQGDKRVKKHFEENAVKNFLEGINGPIKLNIGCGTDYKEGWINIDNNSDNNIEKLDLNWDLRNPLPFNDNSVDFIFNEHLMEHLTVEEGQSMVKNMTRILKSGGIMRIAMPDLEWVIKMYNDPNWKDRPFIKKFGLEFVKTKAEMINMNFRWWGHQWLYDWEELERRLIDVGCGKKIKRCKRGESNYPELQNLEIRSESLLIAEVIK